MWALGSWWWERSCNPGNSNNFLNVNSNGDPSNNNNATNVNAVLPDFPGLEVSVAAFAGEHGLSKEKGGAHLPSRGSFGRRRRTRGQAARGLARLHGAASGRGSPPPPGAPLPSALNDSCGAEGPGTIPPTPR